MNKYLHLATIPFHPFAEPWPLMTGQVFEDFADDLKEKGQFDSIMLVKRNGVDMIADGRNRYLGCLARDIPPTFENLPDDIPDAELLDWVVSKNKHRRHETDSQRAMAGAKLKPLFEEAARQRMLAGKATNPGPDPGANLPQGQEKGKAREKAAEAVGSSPRSIDAASNVLKNGAPEVAKAVEEGDVSVSDAAAIADKPKAVQRKALKKVQEGKAPTLKKAVQADKKKKDEEPNAVKDARGERVPADLLAVWRSGDELDSLHKDLGSFITRLDVLCDSGFFLRLNGIRDNFREYRPALLRQKPKYVCPDCKDGKQPNGRKCEYCHGTGWLTEGDEKERVKCKKLGL